MIRIVIVLLFAVALAFFAAVNPGTVTVRFPFWELKGLPLGLLVILAAAAGAGAVLVALLPGAWRRRRELSRLRREVRDLEGRHLEEPFSHDDQIPS